MPTQNIDFINHEGHRLSARLDMPADRFPRAFALFARCFTCHKNLPAATNIARALASSGIAIMRFDFTGLLTSSQHSLHNDRPGFMQLFTFKYIPIDKCNLLSAQNGGERQANCT